MIFSASAGPAPARVTADAVDRTTTRLSWVESDLSGVSPLRVVPHVRPADEHDGRDADAAVDEDDVVAAAGVGVHDGGERIAGARGRPDGPERPGAVVALGLDHPVDIDAHDVVEPGRKRPRRLDDGEEAAVADQRLADHVLVDVGEEAAADLGEHPEVGDRPGDLGDEEEAHRPPQRRDLAVVHELLQDAGRLEDAPHSPRCCRWRPAWRRLRRGGR